MLPKQNNYSVGIYLRLSKDDERAGESLSIENQRKILVNYVNEQHWKIYDEYVDDGYSGTTFDRPSMQKMLDDAKSGKINLIICKDLSRFGRNYIQVGQYTDYIFPMYNIRFIALTDNVDTANSDNAGMDMMPIMNVFNEWHCANTSKKLRAVFKSNAKMGKYKATRCAYGYIKGNDEKFTPMIDPEAAPVVLRIFEMRATGLNYRRIAEVLTADGIPTPDKHLAKIIGCKEQTKTMIWDPCAIKRILKNPIYIGTLCLQKSTTVSYKNHKIISKDPSEWISIPNNHEAIVPQELWEKAREIEASLSRGKQNRTGETLPLSGMLICDSCLKKLREQSAKSPYANYVCGTYSRYGKNLCTSHYIRRDVIENVVLNDIRAKIEMVLDEKKAKQIFLERKSSSNSVQHFEDEKNKDEYEKRIAELDKLLLKVYEDKVVGKIPEEICISLLKNIRLKRKSLWVNLMKLRNVQKPFRKTNKTLMNLSVV